MSHAYLIPFAPIIAAHGQPHRTGADWSCYTWTLARNGSRTIRLHDAEATDTDGQPIVDIVGWETDEDGSEVADNADLFNGGIADALQWIANNVMPATATYTAIADAIRAHSLDWTGLDWETDFTTMSADDLDLTDAEHATAVAAEEADVAADAEYWHELIEQAADAAEAGDMIACDRHLRAAGRVEAAYGDDPSTQAVYSEIADAIGRPEATVYQIADELCRL